jgi:hypothetical protein
MKSTHSEKVEVEWSGSQFGWAVDIDDVLSETSLAVMERMYTKGFGTNEPVEKLRSLYEYPYLVPQWQGEEAQTEISLTLNDTHFLATLPVKRGAQLTLVDKAPILPVKLYMTSRMPEQYLITRQWLEDYSFPEAPIVMREPDERRGYWKIEHLLEHNIASMGIIDDNKAAFIGHTNYAGWRIWLNDTQATSSNLSEGVARVSNWDEINSLLESGIGGTA